MSYRITRDMNDYVDDYEKAARDYSELGPTWAELVFPNDFEALRALYGGKSSSKNEPEQNREEWVERYKEARTSHKRR